MDKKFKPAGYNSVSPYFIINGAQRFIDLLIEIFDAKEIRRFNRPDGTIMHAEIQIEDSVIMLGQSSEKFPPVPIVIHAYVSNVDQIFAKAIKAGCEVVAQPKELEGDTDRRATFKDFAGNMWSIGTEINQNIVPEEQLITEFQKIEDDFNKAVISNTVAEIKKCITEDWVLVDSQGGIIRQDRFFHAIDEGLLSHDTMTKKVLRVKMYDNMAVVTGRGQNTAIWQNQPLESDEWITDIYRKKHGKWLCALTHLTPVKK